MLTQSELEVVTKCKVHYFGAYLQWAWLEYPSMQREIAKGILPARTRLRKTTERMSEQRGLFEMIYNFPNENLIIPLKVEQEAWKLLSPKVGEHIQDFNHYIQGYSSRKGDGRQLIQQVDLGWNLLQKWNIISESYKAKYEKNWGKLPEREEAVRVLIGELSYS